MGKHHLVQATMGGYLSHDEACRPQACDQHPRCAIGAHGQVVQRLVGQGMRWVGRTTQNWMQAAEARHLLQPARCTLHSTSHALILHSGCCRTKPPWHLLTSQVTGEHGFWPALSCCAIQAAGPDARAQF